VSGFSTGLSESIPFLEAVRYPDDFAVSQYLRDNGIRHYSRHGFF
jgi:hypothetical protein